MPETSEAPGPPAQPTEPEQPPTRSGDPPPEPEASGCRAPSVLARLSAVALLVALDLWSKSAVFAWLATDPQGVTHFHGARRLPLLGDWLAFLESTNYGVAWGLFDEYPQVIVAGRALAVIFLTWLVIRSAPGRRVLTAALVLILAGALGNLHDNLFLGVPGDGHAFGPVRDFIDVYFARWNYHFPTFNTADSCITVGAVLLFLSSFGHREAEPEGDPAPEPSPGPVAEAGGGE